MAAFDNGLALGADGLELDVHLSRDGVVVVHHDATLDRTTSGRGRSRRAPPTSWRGSMRRWLGRTRPYRRAGIGVPTLAEVLRAVSGRAVIIEMKVNTPELARRTIDVVRAADAVERVALGSFGTRVLRAARAIEPRIATSAVARGGAAGRSTDRGCGWPVRRAAYDGFQVPELAGRDARRLAAVRRDAHAAGSACRSGPSTTKPTPAACSAGASTAHHRSARRRGESETVDGRLQNHWRAETCRIRNLTCPLRQRSAKAVVNVGSMSTGTSVRRSSTVRTSERTVPSRARSAFAAS